MKQQLTNNNINGGGSFIEAGLQQINVRAVGQMKTVGDIENTVAHRQERYAALRVKDIASCAAGLENPFGPVRRAIHRADGKIIDNDDVVAGIVLLRKGADGDPRWTRFTPKWMNSISTSCRLA